MQPQQESANQKQFDMQQGAIKSLQDQLLDLNVKMAQLQSEAEAKVSVKEDNLQRIVKAYIETEWVSKVENAVDVVTSFKLTPDELADELRGDDDGKLKKVVMEFINSLIKDNNSSPLAFQKILPNMSLPRRQSLLIGTRR